MAKKDSKSKENTVSEDLKTASLHQDSASDINEGMALQQQIAEAQQEWFSRTPEDNVELLNKDSKNSGVYNFSYTDDAESLPDIPGMNKVTYAIPDDPNGGSYVGYESYEQTYKKAEDEYKSICKDGIPTEEQEQAYQDATEAYSVSKTDYSNYLDDNPKAPDYLKESNPVEAYTDYAIPQAEDALKAQAKDNAVQQQQEAAAGNISMDDVQDALKKGKKGTVEVGTAATSGRYADVKKASEQKFYVRTTDEIDSATIDGVENYTSANGADLPEITAKKDTDEYGRQLVSRIKAIDDELSATDSNYESAFPDNMQYYADGENPKAVPGMTVVVGKIDGVPGCFAGYESYDKTYQTTLDTLDAESADISADDVDAKNAMNEKYAKANEVYDYQKNQYDEYVQENPGNDFLEEDDPVESYNSFDQKAGWTKTLQNVFVNAKEALVSGFNSFVAKADSWLKGKEGDEFMTAEEAAQKDEDYWANRSEKEPMDKETLQNAEDAKEANAEMQAQKEDESESGVENEKTDVSQESFSGTTSAYTPRKNRFRSIVENGTDIDADYEMQNPMSSNGNPYGYATTTGNQQLDELTYGSEDSLNVNVMNNMADRYGDKSVSDSKERGAYGSDATTYRSSDLQRQSDAQPGQSARRRSAENMDRLAELEARLQANSTGPSMDGPEY